MVCYFSSTYIKYIDGGVMEVFKFSGQFKGDTIRSEVLFDNSLVVRLGVDGQELKILTKEYSSVIPE